MFEDEYHTLRAQSLMHQLATQHIISMQLTDIENTRSTGLNRVRNCWKLAILTDTFHI